MSVQIMEHQPPQRSRAWRDQRCGKVTASRLPDLVARTKTGPSASRGSYMTQLLAERLSGEPQLIPASGAMRWGVEHEAEAALVYSFLYDLEVGPCGFFDHPTITGSGASPDGLLGLEGLIEIKCPTSTTHIETLSSGEIPPKHLHQIHWQLACTGRGWCDFVSYDPRMPPELRLFVRRVERDDQAIASLEAEVTSFLQELEARERSLRPLHASPPQDQQRAAADPPQAGQTADEPPQLDTTAAGPEPAAPAPDHTAGVRQAHAHRRRAAA